MITYDNSLFGINVLCRIHGSAAYKACIPALFSSALILIYIKISDNQISENNDHRLVGSHPYTVGSFVAFFSFLLTFRLNYAYQRYWEAATAVHLMVSKWLCAATYLASFHYQSSQFDKCRPPALGMRKNNNKLRNITREREREREITQAEVEEQIRQSKEKQEEDEALRHKWWRKFGVRRRTKHPIETKLSTSRAKTITTGERRHTTHDSSRIPIPRTFQYLQNQFKVTSPQGSPKKRNSIRRSLSEHEGLQSTERLEIPGPSLFLQELVHLLSLLSGVAMSVLRSDVEGADSPLVEYFPGQPMPPVNPDDLASDLKETFLSGSPIMSAIYFLLGLSRSNRHRALYNAARPFPVLGNVSDREVEMLVQAHGGSAKVALVSMWVTELYSREHLHGSTGQVPPPIVSRVPQVLSDGMVG